MSQTLMVPSTDDRSPSDLLPAVLSRVPKPSPELAPLIDDAIRNASTSAQPIRITALEPVRTEAKSLLAAIEPGLEPAGVERVQDWLLQVALLVANLPPDYEDKVRVMSRLLSERPAICFTWKTLGATRFKFFPTYQEVAEAIRPAESALRLRMRALRAVADAPDPAPPRERPDPAMIKAAADATRAALAAVAERREALAAEQPERRAAAARVQATNDRFFVQDLERRAAAGDADATFRLEIRRRMAAARVGESV